MALRASSNFAVMKWKICFLSAFVILSAASAGAQDRRMTIDEVDSIVAHRSLQLRVAQLEIEAAKGQLSQAKKFENPEVQLMHNVQNPENRKWFDAGYGGQTDMQISQPIAIGGQRMNKVRQAEAALNASKAAHGAAVLGVRCEARMTFVGLYCAQQKLKVYDKEISSVERIYEAHGEQTAKGNVSRMQTVRIAAMLHQLRSEKSELLLGVNELQTRLAVLLNLHDGKGIEACMDEEEAMGVVAVNLSRFGALVSPSGEAQLRSVLLNHPGLLHARCVEESAGYAVKAEKADALPRITLNGEWDKNGSIGHNFFAVGATVSVPLWNRNRGNIRSARAQHAQAATERQQRENELRSSLLSHYRATVQNLKLVEEQKQLSADLEQLIDAAEQQFMKRNISVTEFVDMYASYRDTRFQMEDAKAQLMKSNEELKKIVGEVF